MFKLLGVDRDTIKAPQILICCIGEATEFLQDDKAIYQVFQNVIEYRGADGNVFIEVIRGGQINLFRIRSKSWADQIYPINPNSNLQPAYKKDGCIAAVLLYFTSLLSQHRV